MYNLLTLLEVLYLLHSVVRNANLRKRCYEYNNTYRNVSMSENIANDGHFYVTNITMDVNVYINISNLTYYIIGYDNDNNEARYNDTGTGNRCVPACGRPVVNSAAP